MVVCIWCVEIDVGVYVGCVDGLWIVCAWGVWCVDGVCMVCVCVWYIYMCVWIMLLLYIVNAGEV